MRGRIIGGGGNPNFATTLYTGNGSTQSIVTGRNNAAGLTWVKKRNATGNHMLVDSVRGEYQHIISNTNEAQSTDAAILSLNSNGFTLSSNGTYNGSGESYVAWTFLEAAGFFDIVSYTGNSTVGTQDISHNLGVAPAFIIIKNLSTNADWTVFSNTLTANDYLVLNSAGASFATLPPIFSSLNSSSFTVGYANNKGGDTFIAYLFAHNPSQGIACGSFTTDGSGNATVNCGFAPKWILFKPSNAIFPWYMLDTTRGWGGGNDAELAANGSGTEFLRAWGSPTGNGFVFDGGVLPPSNPIVYLAIG